MTHRTPGGHPVMPCPRRYQRTEGWCASCHGELLDDHEMAICDHCYLRALEYLEDKQVFTAIRVEEELEKTRARILKRTMRKGIPND